MHAASIYIHKKVEFKPNGQLVCDATILAIRQSDDLVKLLGECAYMHAIGLKLA